MNGSPTEKINPSPRFKGEILNRIYRVWLFRKLLPVLLLEIAVLTIILFMIGRAVFMQRILENGLNVFFADPPAIFSFLANAFQHASGPTKILTLLGTLLQALAIRHLTQGILRLILVKQNYFSAPVK